MTLRTEKLLIATLLAALLHPVFSLVAETTAARAVLPPPWFVTRIDLTVPLVPSSVWVYVSWYLATGAVLFGGRDTFRQGWLAYAIAFAVCIVLYLVWPITIERPSLEGTQVAERLVRAVYGADIPVNLFPSFHAAVAAVLLRLRPAGRVSTVLVTLWTVLLSASCVLLKQHYVLDVLGGLALGWTSVGLSRAIWLSASLPAEVPVEAQTIR
jgi:membrane-associated phospholipid phosphatase